MNDYERYIAGVLDGSIRTGSLVRLACERHRADLDRDSIYFDPDAAAHALEFFAYLRHSKGKSWAGQPFTLSPWQAFIVAMVFGWHWSATATRRFRIAYTQVARKNGKTTLAAGIALYLFAADREPGAEVYTAATKLEQAKICWTEAKRMARTSGLEEELGLSIGVSNIADPATFSKLEPLPADADSLDGLNTHGCINDEVHQQKTPALYESIETSTEARTDPLIFNITTAGFYRENSICMQLRLLAEQVLTGVIENDEFFAYVAEPDKDDDWLDETTWIKGNPNLGVTVDIERLRRKAETARTIISAQNSFRCKHLDEWTQQAERAIDMNAWNACLPIELALEHIPCYGGLDLGEVRDLSAFVLLFPAPEGGEAVKVLAWFWMPEANIMKRVREDKVPYDAWIKDGWIKATPGNVQDNAFIIADIKALAERFAISEIGYDPYKSLEVTLALADEGIACEPVRQGCQTLAEPWERMIGLIESGKLDHGFNPVLRWMASNTVAYTDTNGNHRPDKKASYERIDGISALLNALSRYIQNPDAGEDIYATRGFASL